MKQTSSTVADANTHMRLAVASVGSVVDRVVPKPGPPRVGVTLRSGLQGGTYVERSQTTITIGSDPSCDLVLLDDSVAPVHARLTFEHSIMGAVARIEAEDEQLLLSAEIIEPHKSVDAIRLPLNLTIGDVELDVAHCSREVIEHKVEQKKGIGQRGILIALVCLFLIFLQTGWMLVNGYVGPKSFEVLRAPAMTTEPAPDAPGGSAEKIGEAATMLAGALESAGLGNDLAVDIDPTGALQVSGILPPGLMGQWQNVQIWFDETVPATALISSVQPAAKFNGLPAVAAVRLSGTPTLLLVNGQRVSLGDTLVDGWKVEEITLDSAKLIRRNETVTIRF